MKKLLIAMGLGLGSLGVAGQTPVPDRFESIWIHAALRMQRQNDFWFKNGDFPRAIQCLKFQAAIFPSNYDIITNLGWMLENEELWSEALAVYIKFRIGNPNDPEAAFPEGEYYFNKKAYDKVPPVIEPSLKVGNGPSPNSYRILAHSYEKLNLLADSVRIWKLYLVRVPTDAMAKNNLSRVEKKLHGGS